MRILKSIIAVSALAAATAFPNVDGLQAKSVEIVSGNKKVEISCSGTCEFWYLDLDPAGFSAENGSWLESGAGNGADKRIDFVNDKTGHNFSVQSESSDSDLSITIPKFDNSDKENASWTGSALYYLAWGGPDPRYILIKNLTADNNFFWTQTSSGGTQSGAGLSGVDGFGVVPLPAAGWLLLSAVGGWVFVGRRRRANTA